MATRRAAVANPDLALNEMEVEIISAKLSEATAAADGHGAPSLHA